MSFIPTKDNVLLRLLPLDAEIKSDLIDTSAMTNFWTSGKACRHAIVVAAGPGHHRQRRVPRGRGLPASTLCEHDIETDQFIPTELKPGQRVIIDHDSGDSAGHAYRWNKQGVPRHNVPCEFDSFGNERGEYRVVREDEVLAVFEEE